LLGEEYKSESELYMEREQELLDNIEEHDEEKEALDEKKEERKESSSLREGDSLFCGVFGVVSLTSAVGSFK
jgi:hypothetical protein